MGLIELRKDGGECGGEEQRLLETNQSVDALPHPPCIKLLRCKKIR